MGGIEALDAARSGYRPRCRENDTMQLPHESFRVVCITSAQQL